MNRCVAAGITPYIAPGREAHHPPVEQRWTSPPPLAADANVVDEMKHRMATPQGQAVYAQRKSTVEPVFGIVKSVLGFRQFHLRGLKNVSGEWTLVSIAWNLKRLFHLGQQQTRPPVCKGRKSRSDVRGPVPPRALETIEEPAVHKALKPVHGNRGSRTVAR